MRLESIGRSTLVLAAITAGVKVLGFVEKQLLARYFGADERVDAFFVAVSVPTLLFVFVREIIEPAFLPYFVRYVDAGRHRSAWQLFAVVAATITVVTLVGAVAGWVGVEALVLLLAPGFSESARELTAQLLRITMGCGVFLGLSSLTYTTLNGYQRFALPASGDLVLKLAPVVGALFFVSEFGIAAFAVGVVVGAGGRLLIHLFGLRNELRHLAWPRQEGWSDVRRLGWITAPLVVGMLFSQISDLADNYFASQLGGGAVSARIYARKIVDLPILLLPYVLSVVTFPFFSSLAAGGEWDRLYRFFGLTLRSLAILFAFLGVATVLLAGPLVSILLERGSFDAQDRLLTAWPLRWYAAGLMAFAIEALLVPFYYALGDTRTPVAVGILGVGVNITLTALLIGPFGVGGVAAALTASKTLKVILLGLLLWWRSRDRSSRNGPDPAPVLRLVPVLATGLRLGVAMSIAAGTMLVAMLWHPEPQTTAPLAIRAGYILLVSGYGLAMYFATILAYRSPERALTIRACQLLRRLVADSRRIRGLFRNLVSDRPADSESASTVDHDEGRKPQ